jgi:adenosylmethionine-8-amino-7-oxononanoate aminotransferase
MNPPVPDPRTDAWIAADRAHSWHPFTQMRDWCGAGPEPLVIVSGQGAVLRDSRGREYLDGNSSIWTNLHGHNHPKINAAITRQLSAFAHSSFLGLTHPLAIELAVELVGLFPPHTLTRVFYSDDGSTAVEAALRLATQYWQLAGQPERRRFLSFEGAYHGDTLGAARLGGIAMFHQRLAEEGPPAVLRVADLAALDSLSAAEIRTLAAAVIEPLIQGAAGMRLWPAGMLAKLRAWCDRHGVLLIADEVMTGFGRTGTMFAAEREHVLPDFLCLAKGLTGGYLPLAATLTTEKIFAAFLGEYAERKTFFYGHSYTGSALGCAAALANLAIFREGDVLARLQPRIGRLAELLQTHLAPLAHVGGIRQCGFIAGIDLLADPETGQAFPWEAQTGARVCVAARRPGLLTRPIGDTLVLMPPYCVSESQLERMVLALRMGVQEAAAGPALQES